ncbi:P-loop containing nucleoside triphosphate hydrolase protein [Helicostylum pulchrum]|nr:P-loop containing nucleoside triphosphate hydrolase protein [Helicostylum pulchrum]
MVKDKHGDIDPSHIIRSKRRSRTAINYSENNDSPKKTTRVAKPATKPRATKATKPTKPAKPVKVEHESSASSDSDSYSSVEEAEDSPMEEDSAEEDSAPEEKVIKKVVKRGRKPASTRKKILSSTSTSTRKKPSTSSNRTVQRVNQAVPIVPLRRVHERDQTDQTPYALARERLHVSAVPDSLPCREDEFMNIMGYIESAIHEGTGTCVYISGVPGTGKTATVLEVIRHLQQQAEDGTIPNFDFVEINGMKLTDPNQAYSILWQCMDKDKKRYTASHALQLLEAKFSKQSDDQKTTVVLMDELDLLVTKKQTVMYNFFDWPSRPLSKLIVVAVANTMDLPERIMSNKIASRMGLTRINFQPYKYDQLYQIVQSRLRGIDAFAKEAVEFAARKVSAVSGDARRALDICRRAVEIIENKAETGAHVTIAIVDEAIKEMFTSPSVAFIRSCSLHQKIFLVACMQRSRAIGLAEIEFGDVAHYHIQTCKWHNIEPPNTSDLMRVCESLGQTRALLMEGGRMDICMRLSLNLVEEDIVMACKADKLISRLLQNLTSH